jgi:hypothetical protein
MTANSEISEMQTLSVLQTVVMKISVYSHSSRLSSTLCKAVPGGGAGRNVEQVWTVALSELRIPCGNEQNTFTRGYCL